MRIIKNVYPKVLRSKGLRTLLVKYTYEDEDGKEHKKVEHYDYDDSKIAFIRINELEKAIGKRLLPCENI